VIGANVREMQADARSGPYVSTGDGMPTAHEEHTIMVAPDGRPNR